MSAPAASRPAPARPRVRHDHPVIEGPRWYRSRIRGRGPLVGLVVPALLGIVAISSLWLFDTASSGAVGLIGGVCAAPGLLVVGAPFGDRSLYPLAIAGSGVLWLFVGWLAARRATRNPLATWADYWRHYLTLAGGIWIGVGIALGIAAASVGESLF